MPDESADSLNRKAEKPASASLSTGQTAKCTLKRNKKGYSGEMMDLLETAGGRVVLEPENLQDRDALFERARELYPDMRIEMDEEGNILLMPPASLESGFGSGEVFGQLREWAIRDGTGRACDATGTYNLPTGAKM